MSLRSSPWPDGMPCWVDLMTSDIAAAQQFYADVLGWSYQDTGDEYGGYVIAEVAGAVAAGIGPQRQGARTAWTLYLASADADRTVAAIAANRGTVLLAPGDVGPLGRMAVAADPAGAPFGIWQAGTHIGCGIVNEPGGLAWDDLRSTDPDAARRFYTAIFGYRNDELPGAGPAYTTFALPDDPAPMGGIGGLAGPDDASSTWLVYFGVADADAAVVAAERGGGSVLTPAFDTPYGRMAGLADLGGAAFWVAQTNAGSAPDRAD